MIVWWSKLWSRKKGPKWVIINKYPLTIAKKVTVRLVGGPDGTHTQDEWNVIIETEKLNDPGFVMSKDGAPVLVEGIWGYGKTEEEAWKDAVERLERVGKL